MRWVAAILVLSLAVPATGGTPLVVIVHPSRTDTPNIDELERIYLRKRRFWSDGSPIVPLNREVGSPEREAFSTRILGTRSTFLASYWNEAYFHGVFPPAVLASGAAVKRYVAADPRAIGYVDADEVDDSVHVVLSLDEGGPGGRQH